MTSFIVIWSLSSPLTQACWIYTGTWGWYSVARPWATSTPLIKCKHDEDGNDDEEEVEDDDDGHHDDDVIDVGDDDNDNDDKNVDDDDDIVNGDDWYNEVTKRELVIDI